MCKKNNLEIIVVLDNIRSMHNIGSIFRTCDAMPNCKIYLCGICATPPNKEIYKTALGATKSVKWKYFKKTELALAYLIKNNYAIIAIEQTSNSIMLDDFSVNDRKIALIFGNEVKGISENTIKSVKTCVQIQQHGTKQSMNVSVVAGIVLWAITHNTTVPKIN